MYSEKQERDYVLGLFQQGLEPYRKKRIALYGLGVNTFYILEHSNYNIVALMDANKEGDVIEGLPVLSVQEAREQVDVIVVVARVSVIPIIYKRIKQLEANVLILDIHGDAISIQRQLGDIENNPYWEQTYEKLLRTIDKYDVISFDVFDTLLMRKIMRPSDLFSVIGKQVKEKFAIEFEMLRHMADEAANKKYLIATYDEIYQEFENISHLEHEVVEQIKEIEYATEKKFLMPRKAVVDAFWYALKHKKRVFLVTDMYFTREYMEQLLINNGISGYEDLLISSEERAAKWPKGELFQRLIQRYNIQADQVLHIGDSPGGDIEVANSLGMHGFQVLSAYEMLVQSSISEILAYASTTEDYIIIGQILGAFFADPFSLSEYKGRIYIDTFEKIGYLGYGGLFIGFILWAIALCNRKKINKILFLARDGYPIEKVYQNLKRKKFEEDIPEAVYVLSSRACLAVSSLYNEADLRALIARVIPDVAGTGRHILYNRFGIEPDPDDKEADEVRGIEELHQYIWRYRDRILQNASKIRQEYLDYLHQLGIKNSDNIAIFDTQTLGTAAYYFEKLFGAETTLLAYILINAVDYSLYDDQRSYAFIGKDTVGMAAYQYTRACTLNECIYTSDAGQFFCIKDGEPVFLEKERPQLYFEKISCVHEAIGLFADEYCGLTSYGLQLQSVSALLGDSLVGCLKNGSCVIREELKQYFAMQDNFAGNGAENFGFA